MPKLIRRTDPFADCDGCFLRERTGGVCPMVRQGPPDQSEEAERLHGLLLQEGGAVPSFSALVLGEAVSQTGELPAAIRLLPALSVAYSVHPDSREEVSDAEAIRVAPRRRLR